MGPHVSRALGFKQPPPQSQSRQERREQERQERRKREREATQQQSQPPQTQGEGVDLTDLCGSLEVPYGTLPRPQREFRIAALLDLHASGHLGAGDCMRKMNVRKQDRKLFMSDLRSIYEGFQDFRGGSRASTSGQIRMAWMKKILGET
jgi:hypothetical protein